MSGKNENSGFSFSGSLVSFPIPPGLLHYVFFVIVNKRARLPQAMLRYCLEGRSFLFFANHRITLVQTGFDQCADI